MGGHRKRLLEPHRALVIDRVKAVPDITLKALVRAGRTGHRHQHVSVWRLVRSEGLRFKKNAVDRPAAGAVEEVSGAA